MIHARLHKRLSRYWCGSRVRAGSRGGIRGRDEQWLVWFFRLGYRGLLVAGGWLNSRRIVHPGG